MSYAGGSVTAGRFNARSRMIGKRRMGGAMVGGAGSPYYYTRQKGQPGAYKEMRKVHYLSRQAPSPKNGMAGYGRMSAYQQFVKANMQGQRLGSRAAVNNRMRQVAAAWRAGQGRR